MPRNTAITRRSRDLESTNATRVGKKTPKNAELILADLSSSMYGQPYQILSQALKPLAQSAHVIAFNDSIFEVNADNLPRPDGTTALHLALDKAATLEPLHVLVISDGAPNSQNQAFDSAKVLAAECIIDVLFVGSANDERCIEFMKKLAEIGRGRYQSLDLSGATALMLGSKVNDMLALPSPKGSIEL